MNDVIEPPRPPLTPPGSERVRLARVSREAALDVPGVVETDPGSTGRFTTAGDGERIPGVTSLASAGGGYDVALRLRCKLVPLPDLGQQVATAVRRAAAGIGLTVADLRVDVVDVVERV